MAIIHLENFEVSQLLMKTQLCKFSLVSSHCLPIRDELFESMHLM